MRYNPHSFTKLRQVLAWAARAAGSHDGTNFPERPNAFSAYSFQAHIGDIPATSSVQLQVIHRDVGGAYAVLIDPEDDSAVQSAVIGNGGAGEDDIVKISVRSELLKAEFTTRLVVVDAGGSVPCKAAIEGIGPRDDGDHADGVGAAPDAYVKAV